MEKSKDLSPHRHRSFQAIVSDGYRLYAQNFWCLVRSSWIQAAVYALVVGFCMAWFFSSVLPGLFTHNVPLTRAAVWGGSLAAFLLAAVAFAFAGGVAPLHEHWNAGAIGQPQRWWGRWPWRLTLGGLKALPAMLGKTVRKRQLGVLVAVALVMLLVVAVATVVLQLPALILTAANVEAQLGMAAGDAVGMPENIWLLNFFTYSACGLLQAYIHLSTLFPLYYVWGNCSGGHTDNQNLALHTT